MKHRKLFSKIIFTSILFNLIIISIIFFLNYVSIQPKTVNQNWAYNFVLRNNKIPSFIKVLRKCI